MPVVAAQPPNFTPPIPVISGHATSAQIAIDPAGDVHLLWCEVEPGFRQSKVLYARSTDHGATFSPSMVVASSVSAQPRLAVSADGIVYVAWVDIRRRRFAISVSRDGRTFSQPTYVADGTVGSLAADRAGLVYVAWDEYVQKHFEVRLASSHDLGRTFSKPITVTADAEGFRSPAITVDNEGRLLVVWEGPGISVSRLDSRETVGKPVVLPRGLVSEDHLPSIKAAAKQHVYIAWEAVKAKQSAIMFSRSEDDGQTFSLPANISRSSGDAWDPRLEVAPDGTIDVVWSNSSGAGSGLYNQRIAFSRSVDGGRTFSQPTVFSEYPVSFNPAIAVDNQGNTYVVWEHWNSTTGPSVGSDLLLSRSRPDEPANRSEQSGSHK